MSLSFHHNLTTRNCVKVDDMKFEYRVGGACYRDSVVLEWDNETYKLTASSASMVRGSYDNEQTGPVLGTTGACTAFQNDKDKSVFKVYRLLKPSEYIIGVDQECATMIMANEGKCASEYNALLVGMCIPEVGAKDVVLGWFTE